MKFLIFLCIFALTRASIDHDVVGRVKVGELPVADMAPTYRDFVETSNLNLILRLAKRIAADGFEQLVPFDPLTGDVDTFEIQGLPDINGNVSLSDLKVTGIKQYQFPALLVQSQSLVDEEQKLVSFENTIPELEFTGTVKASFVDKDINIAIDLSLGGSSKGITNVGQLGLSKRFFGVGRPKYQIDSYNIETKIEELQLDILNRHELSRRSRNIALLETTKGDIIAALVSAAVQEELNKALDGLYADQVDAFLRTGVPDEIIIEETDLDGKSKSGEIPEALTDPDYNDLIETSNLKTVIDMTKRIAAVGLLDIPVFEPYNAGRLEPIKLGTGISVVLEPSNVIVEGLREFSNSLQLQSSNLSIKNAKLLKFTQSFRELAFTAHIDMNLGVLTSCNVRGIATSVVNNGSLGIQRVPAPHAKEIGELVYQVTSFDVENRISKLKLIITDIKTVAHYVPTARLENDIVQELADKVSYAVGKAVQKQINASLEGLKPEQVEAFLLPEGWVRWPRIARRI